MCKTDNTENTREITPMSRDGTTPASDYKAERAACLNRCRIPCDK